MSAAGGRAIRTPVIAGNWKMNRGPTATREYFRHFKARWAPRADRTVLFFPPAVSLVAAAEMLRDRPDLGLGAQNIFWEQEGAFTGEQSASMVRDAGARYVLAGHSERRHIFGESDEQVARKVVAALEADLIPVICLGETLEERRAGRVEEVILRQLDAVLEALPRGPDAAILVAYEPVWAIGTGVNASPEDASAAHAILRRRLAEHAGADRAAAIPILYGGSVKPDNADALLSAPDVDGLLVGGASLDPGSFAAIAAARPG
ncbi:MAG TPA: triose-phosphate isomerase [Longimicrobiales bacterium]